MANKSKNSGESVKARYEYRVWGQHRKARKLLAQLASSTTRERIEDCYLLVADPSWNAKVRNDALKIKQLVAEDEGFERWASATHRSSDTAPSPFDTLFDELQLDRLRPGKPKDLVKAVSKLDPESGVRTVFVTKHRRRYRVGNLRAEVTDVTITETNDTIRTLSIEGDDLDELVALRKKLGLRDAPNTPVHQAIDSENEL